MPKRKTRAKKPKLDRPFVKEQIEAMPDITSLEMAWVKKRRMSLNEAALKRGPDWVSPDWGKKGKFFIHSHPGEGIGSASASSADIRAIKRETKRVARSHSKAKARAKAVIDAFDAVLFPPSPVALFHAAKQLISPKIARERPSTNVIASISKKGKVVGYTFIKPTKRLMENIKSNRRQLNRVLKQKYIELMAIEKEEAKVRKQGAIDMIRYWPDSDFSPEYRKELAVKGEKAFKEFKEKQQTLFSKTLNALRKMGFKTRFVPMPGYEFNKVAIEFWEKPRAKRKH